MANDTYNKGEKIELIGDVYEEHGLSWTASVYSEEINKGLEDLLKHSINRKVKVTIEFLD